MAAYKVLTLLTVLAFVNAICEAQVYKKTPYEYDNLATYQQPSYYPYNAPKAVYGSDNGYKKYSAHRYNGLADVHVYQNPKHYEFSVSEKGPGYSKYVRQSAESPVYGYGKY